MQSVRWCVTGESKQAREWTWCPASGHLCRGSHSRCCALLAQDLDLSCNNIGALANLGACRQLTRLDLSNNCLSCLARAEQMCGGLRRLVLRVRCAACCFQISFCLVALITNHKEEAACGAFAGALCTTQLCSLRQAGC